MKGLPQLRGERAAVGEVERVPRPHLFNLAFAVSQEVYEAIDRSFLSRNAKQMSIASIMRAGYTLHYREVRTAVSRIHEHLHADEVR